MDQPQNEVAFVFEGVAVLTVAPHNQRPCPKDPADGPCDYGGGCDFCPRNPD